MPGPSGFGPDTVLDAPPPSPAQPPMPKGGLGSMASGAGMATGMGAANQAMGSATLTPQIRQSIVDAGTQIGLMLDDFARNTPDLADLLDATKESLQAYLGALMSAGAGPTGPTAPGPNFPGGGFAGGPRPM